MSNRKPFVLVTVEGGVAYTHFRPSEVDVVEIDWDNADEGTPDEIASMLEDAKSIPDEYASGSGMPTGPIDKAGIIESLELALANAREAYE